MIGEFLEAQREQAGDSSTGEKTIFRLTFYWTLAILTLLGKSFPTG
jgi:hypothetical protein